jgi:RNA polymerase sigma factor (sigma-70 family)
MERKEFDHGRRGVASATEPQRRFARACFRSREAYGSRRLDVPLLSPPSPSQLTGTDHDRWFAEEVRPHEGSLRTYLRARFPHLKDIDDLVQETYSRLIRARMAGPVTSPKSLLFTTARNAAYDICRRQRVVSIEGMADMDQLSVLEDRPAAAEIVSHAQELDLLAAAIRELPERCRQVLTLRKIYGLSHKEIADQLGISINTVNNQLSIGIERCRQYFAQRGIHGTGSP